MEQNEIYLGTFKPERLVRDVRDMSGVTVVAKKGSLAIVLGDDFGDNDCTLWPKLGEYQAGQKYRLIALPEPEGTDV